MGDFSFLLVFFTCTNTVPVSLRLQRRLTTELGAVAKNSDVWHNYSAGAAEQSLVRAHTKAHRMIDIEIKYDTLALASNQARIS